jgi:hypothetical protein
VDFAEVGVGFACCSGATGMATAMAREAKDVMSVVKRIVSFLGGDYSPLLLYY